MRELNYVLRVCSTLISLPCVSTVCSTDTLISLPCVFTAPCCVMTLYFGLNYFYKIYTTYFRYHKGACPVRGPAQLRGSDVTETQTQGGALIGCSGVIRG
jgi:hypothetical protein